MTPAEIRAALETLVEQHTEIEGGGICDHVACFERWPCPTRRALDALELLLPIVEALAAKKHSNDAGILLPSELQKPTLDSLIERSRAALDMPKARRDLAQ